VLALALIPSDAHAFGYPDDFFFTFTRQKVQAPGCGSSLIWLPPTRPLLVLRGVSADTPAVRRSARRTLRSVRRQLAACRPELHVGAHVDVVIAMSGGRARPRTSSPIELDASSIACVERVLARAPWPTDVDGEIGVHLRWSVVQTVLGP